MRERILKETVSLIRQKGFSFTVADLAKNLGTSKRTIYRCFASKDEIIEAIIKDVAARISAKEKEIAGRNDWSVPEKIRRILCYVPAEFALMHPPLFSDLKKHHYRQWEILDDFLKNEWSTVRRLMDEGIKQGALRPVDVEVFIDLYLGAVSRIFDPGSAPRETMTVGQQLQAAVDILLNGIVSRSEKGE